MKNKILLFLVLTIIFYLAFGSLIISETIRLQCDIEVKTKTKNFRDAAFRLGVIDISVEKKYINIISTQLINECIQK